MCLHLAQPPHQQPKPQSSRSWSAFAADLKLLAFRWYTPWGATGAADGVEAGPGRGAKGARGGPGEPLITNQSPAKLYFRQTRATPEPQNKIYLTMPASFRRAKTLFNRGKYKKGTVASLFSFRLAWSPLSLFHNQNDVTAYTKSINSQSTSQDAETD